MCIKLVFNDEQIYLIQGLFLPPMYSPPMYRVIFSTFWLCYSYKLSTYFIKTVISSLNKAFLLYIWYSWIYVKYHLYLIIIDLCKLSFIFDIYVKSHLYLIFMDLVKYQLYLIYSWVYVKYHLYLLFTDLCKIHLYLSFIDLRKLPFIFDIHGFLFFTCQLSIIKRICPCPHWWTRKCAIHSLSQYSLISMLNYHPNLTLRKIAIWLVKKLPKTWHFFKKNCQKF